MGREIETYLNETIPVNALNRIKEKVLTITDVREVMSWAEDPPHQIAHILDTINTYHYLAKAANLTPIETNLGERALRLHDVGYKFVVNGILKSEERHWGSLYIASIVDPDEMVLEAVRLHVFDILPKDTPMWIRLVRDADRIGELGFTGMNRLAHYFGFNDPDLSSKTITEIIDSKIYCNLTPPPEAYTVLKEYLGYEPATYKLYEKEAWKYFISKVAPFLKETGQLRKFAEYLQILDGRFSGHRPFLTDEKNVVEPVVSDARKMYELKQRYTDIVWSEIAINSHSRLALDPNSDLVANLKKHVETVVGYLWEDH